MARPLKIRQTISPSRGTRCQCDCGLGRWLELLRERQALALVVRADALAINLGGRVGHLLVAEPSDGLAVLEHEGDLVRAHLEHGFASGACLTMAEAGIEEAR